MPTFTYKAMDAHDRFITGEIEAADPREVSRELEKLGYVVLDTETGMRGATSKSTLLRLFHRPAGRREMTVFLRELSLVLRAGLTLDDALLLLAGEEKAGLAAIVRDLRVTITGGASFGDALQRHPRLFGPDLVAMVRVAEASGNLDGVLESVGEERARTERLLDKISSALRYPAVLLVVALSVLTFFLVVVVPQFASVLRDFGQAPSGLVGVVLATSDFFVAYGLWVAGILVALAALFVLIMLRPRPRAVVVGYISRLPGLRGILELRRTVLFCSSLGTLLANGVTLTAALRVLVDLPGASSGGLDRVVEGVRRGGRLVDALSRIGYIPPLALKMLRVGEESGELAIVARRTAEFYESKLSDRLDRLAGVVGPTAIVVIAAIVGTLIVSILSALLSVNQLVG
ncbi:MAG: type II secretion system F family protein [Pseudolabrys sp.]|jgi:general secretion pathway protein F